MPLAHKYHLWVLLCIILHLVLEKRSSIDFGYVLHHPAQEFDIIYPFDEERSESITITINSVSINRLRLLHTRVCHFDACNIEDICIYLYVKTLSTPPKMYFLEPKNNIFAASHISRSFLPNPPPSLCYPSVPGEYFGLLEGSHTQP